MPLMKYITDRDGKSKTASAVDQDHYPEQNEVANPELGGLLPTHEEIALRAFALWAARGFPEGSPEVDWFQAEQELLDGMGPHSVSQGHTENESTKLEDRSIPRASLR